MTSVRPELPSILAPAGPVAAASTDLAWAMLAGSVGASLEAPDAQALALAQGVERQADMPTNAAPALVLDRTGFMAQVAVQELAERPLADEADAGRVLLLRVRQADLGGEAAHLALLQLADREQRA